MENNDKPVQPDVKPFWIRNSIALTISVITIAGTVLIGLWSIIIVEEKNIKESLDFISKSLIPLWATWFGTVLAFYFSKENFEAASRSYQAIIKQLSPEEKLASMAATAIMIPFDQIYKLTTPDDLTKTLKEIINDPDFMKYNRVAIFTGSKQFSLMIHLSTIYRYRSDLIEEHKKSTEEIDKVILKDMLSNYSAEISRMLGRGYNFVPKTATLLDVKKAMEATPECQDVFITENGKKEEVVIGLITNNRLLENAKV